MLRTAVCMQVFTAYANTVCLDDDVLPFEFQHN